MIIHELKTSYKIKKTKDEVAFTTPESVALYLKDAYAEHAMQESFWIIALNGANEPMFRKMITLGIANQTQVHPREVFRFAVLEGAVSIILSHNHPSGALKPSAEDIETTKNLIAAGKVLRIPVLDHVIIAGNSWASIRSHSPGLDWG